MDEIPRYTDLPHAIRLARAKGMSTQEIVRAMTGSMSFGEARKTARKAAPLLEITVKEFLGLRKNTKPPLLLR